MDLGRFEYFGIVGSYSSIMLMLPVIIVVGAVVLVFAFGLQDPKQPRFKRILQQSDGSLTKKVRRKDKKSSALPNAQVPLGSGSSKEKEQQFSAGGKTGSGNISAVIGDAKKSPSKDAKKKKTTPEHQPTDTAATPNTPAKKNAKSTSNQTKQQQQQLSASSVATQVTPPHKSKKQKQHDKQQLLKASKPDDYDDGDWLTVSSKNDKRKVPSAVLQQQQQRSPSGPAASDSKLLDDVIVANKKTVKKQPQPQSPQSKRIAKHGETVKSDAPIAVNAVVAPVASEIEVQIAPITTTTHLIDEQDIVVDRQTAEIIEQIEDAIVDIDDKLVVAADEEEAATITTDQQNVTEAEPTVPEDVDNSSVAFDELGDMWTEAKQPKKGKKKLRKE